METIKTLIGTYNEALRGDSVAAIVTAKENLSSEVANYNEELRHAFFEDFLKEGIPMIAAITAGEVPQIAIKLKVSKDGVSSAEDAEENKVINLVEFEDYAKTKVSQHGGWRWKIEPFTRNVLKNLSEGFCSKADFTSFEMSKKAEQSPVASSNTQLTKQLQDILDGLVEGYKVDSRDLKYIKGLALKRGKSLRSITNIRPQTMLELVEIAVNRIVTNGEYTVEFKSTVNTEDKKEDKKA